jgi:hypothetical protein
MLLPLKSARLGAVVTFAGGVGEGLSVDGGLEALQARQFCDQSCAFPLSRVEALPNLPSLVRSGQAGGDFARQGGDLNFA